MLANTTPKWLSRYAALRQHAAVKPFFTSKRIVFLVLIMYLMAVTIFVPVFLASHLF